MHKILLKIGGMASTVPARDGVWNWQRWGGWRIAIYGPA